MWIDLDQLSLNTNDSKETPSKLSHGDSKGRHRNMSFSSKRSTRSDASQDSHRDLTMRNLFRNRRLSQTSMRSQAVADDSDNESVGTNALSRKTYHADDSDASGTDESLGETEEDVWFRDDIHPDGDINVDELDQLLNLSEEESDRTSQNRSSLPRIIVSSRSKSEGALSPKSLGVLGDNNTTNSGISPMQSHVSSNHPDNRSDNRPETGQLQKEHGQVQETTVGHSADKQPSFNPPGSLLLSNNETSKQFVKYTPTIPDEKRGGFSELVDDSSNSSSSLENKGPYVSDIRGQVFINNPIDSPGNEEKSANAGTADGIAGVSSQRCAPVSASAVTATAPADYPAGGDGIEDQQSQRFSFYSAGMENTIHAPDLASLVREDDSFSSLFNPQNGTWFLDCFRPTQVEMKALSRAFGIHPLTAEDIQTEEAREKFEKFNNYYLVVYHTFEFDDADEKVVKPINFYILVFNEGVISFHFEPVSHCRNVRRRMRQLRDHLTFTSDWVAYALIDDITDSFAPQIHDVEKEADFVENAVYLDRNSAESMHILLKRLGKARRLTMHLLRMLAGKADVVRGFAKRCGEVHNTAGNEMALYLGDIQDHIVTMYQNLSAYEKIFSRSHFNYMGLLQMEFVDSSNQMTEILGKVTVLGTVLLPMNLVTGLFGMNVHVPGQDGDNLHWFAGIIACMVGVIIILLVTGAIYMRWSMKRRLSYRY